MKRVTIPHSQAPPSVSDESTFERIWCDYPAGKAAEMCRALVVEGWEIVDGHEFYEVSRALGCAWPVATLEMRRGDERRSLRFVGKADNQLFLYSDERPH